MKPLESRGWRRRGHRAAGGVRRTQAMTSLPQRAAQRTHRTATLPSRGTTSTSAEILGSFWDVPGKPQAQTPGDQ